MKLFLSTFAATVAFALNEGAHALNVKIPGVIYTARNSMNQDNDSAYCKSAAEVEEDMIALANSVERVRITSLTDCNQAELVLPAAKKAKVFVMLGLWTSNNPDQFAAEKAKLGSLMDSGLYDNNVIAVCVGNEAVHRGEIPIATAITYVNETRDFIRERGHDTQVTVAETPDVLENSGDLMDAVDFFAINVVPDTYIFDSMVSVLNQIRALRGYARGRKKFISLTQTGWSSGGNGFNAGVAHPQNQARYFAELYQFTTWMDVQFYWYQAFVPKWGGIHGGNEVDAYYGIFNDDRTLKSNFQDLTINVKRMCYFRQSKSQLYLSESDRDIYMFDIIGGWTLEDEQRWLIDTTTNEIQSFNSATCLDGLYTVMNTSIIVSKTCTYPLSSQMWSYDSSTGQILQISDNRCLNVQQTAHNNLTLEACSSTDDNQKWTQEMIGRA
ncbi:putative ricin B, lectin domain, glycoside hydrolase superfamily, ricin B-like lectin [Plasmopara halstedii]